MEGKPVDQGAVKIPEPARKGPRPHPGEEGGEEPTTGRGKGRRAAAILLVLAVCAAFDNVVDHPHALSPYGWAALAACALIALYARKD